MHFRLPPIESPVTPHSLSPQMGQLQQEALRPRSVALTGLLDTAHEQEFDQIVELAAAICDVPISLICLVDAERQWFKASWGLPLAQTSREISFCTHAIREDGLMMVPDATLDERFASNPLVTGEPKIRFYAGFPLFAEDGIKVGTLCVLDRVPRQLTVLQQNALRVLSRQVMTCIQLKMNLAALTVTLLENQRIAADLQCSEVRFRAFMEALPAAAFIKDERGRMLFCNDAMTRTYRATPDQWIGKTDCEIWPPEIAEKLRAKDLAVMAAGQMVRFDDEVVGADLKATKWDVSMFPFRDCSEQRFIAAVGINVTRERTIETKLRDSQQQMRELNLKLHKLALTDGLTRVKNRRGLEDCLQREFERSRRSNAPLSLLMLDVDHFKQFNDVYGHVAGDQVLQRIAMLMKENTRRYDLVARYGGEEFTALLPDTQAPEASQIAIRLCRAIAADTWKHRPITVSVGVGSLQPEFATASDFIHAVDQALYVAKDTGRNQVCVSGGPRACAIDRIGLQRAEASA